ncbi:magnesium transporter [Gallibacter intestinalis]|uniref:Magnesium transporter MgtE n=1 Tax=Gallibacter intestinalis TaxID=2779356 RepID=A0ABR9QYL3_9FIRM|nr:magnesium transporter [Gallibacter intestinalis]MBE5035941.1 magnesium transporter [Gallibacter intestinalis]
MDEKKTFDEAAEEIVSLAGEKHFKTIREKLLVFNSPDIAEILEEVLEEVGITETVIIFRLLPKDISVEVFSYLPSDDQVRIINAITDTEISYIIDELDFDDKIDVLEELPANLVDKILEKTPKNERSLINTFLNYPEDCAGTLMTPDYISLEQSWTVRRALRHIKNVGMDSETVYTCYVKSAGRVLEGIVSLRTLVVSDDDVLISDLMHTDIVSINVYEDQEEVSEKFKKYGFIAIPVVDNEKRLVGIITVDDIFDVIEEEATEDMERMAGVLDDSDTEYLDMSVWQQVKNRFPWLFFLMLSYILTGSIISTSEATLASVPALIIYMPMLMGTGGNSGSQSATLVIRGLSVGDIELKDALRVLWKEFRISFVIGLSLSVLNFVRVMIEQRGDPLQVQIALTVSVAMVAIVVAAKCIGSMLPMAAKKVGIDPALMASPMISSLTDMVSIGTYLLLAGAFLGVIG